MSDINRPFGAAGPHVGEIYQAVRQRQALGLPDQATPPDRRVAGPPPSTHRGPALNVHGEMMKPLNAVEDPLRRYMQAVVYARNAAPMPDLESLLTPPAPEVLAAWFVREVKQPPFDHVHVSSRSRLLGLRRTTVRPCWRFEVDAEVSAGHGETTAAHASILQDATLVYSQGAEGAAFTRAAVYVMASMCRLPALRWVDRRAVWTAPQPGTT